jgi:hypothetical protein
MEMSTKVLPFGARQYHRLEFVDILNYTHGISE